MLCFKKRIIYKLLLIAFNCPFVFVVTTAGLQFAGTYNELVDPTNGTDVLANTLDVVVVAAVVSDPVTDDGTSNFCCRNCISVWTVFLCKINFCKRFCSSCVSMACICCWVNAVVVLFVLFVSLVWNVFNWFCSCSKSFILSAISAPKFEAIVEDDVPDGDGDDVDDKVRNVFCFDAWAVVCDVLMPDCPFRF